MSASSPSVRQSGCRSALRPAWSRCPYCGWRLDYFFVSPDLKDSIVDAEVYPDVMGSDHCPVSLTLDL
jgi:exonuclease III